MSQYLNGLGYVMTQLCGCYTSIPKTLALQHRTCKLQFSNIVCHKIFQYTNCGVANFVQKHFDKILDYI